MFAHAYFPSAFFAPVYYPPAGSTPPTPPAGAVDPGDKPPYRRSPHRGFDLEEWRRNRGALDESLDATIERTWAELTGAGGEVRAEAERIVAPFVQTGDPLLPHEPAAFVVDWAALGRELSAVQALAEAHARAKARQRLLEADDEVITILLLDS